MATAKSGATTRQLRSSLIGASTSPRGPVAATKRLSSEELLELELEAKRREVKEMILRNRRYMERHHAKVITTSMTASASEQTLMGRRSLGNISPPRSRLSPQLSARPETPPATTMPSSWLQECQAEFAAASRAADSRPPAELAVKEVAAARPAPRRRALSAGHLPTEAAPKVVVEVAHTPTPQRLRRPGTARLSPTPRRLGGEPSEKVSPAPVRTPQAPSPPRARTPPSQPMELKAMERACPRRGSGVRETLDCCRDHLAATLPEPLPLREMQPTEETKLKPAPQDAARGREGQAGSKAKGGLRSPRLNTSPTAMPVKPQLRRLSTPRRCTEDRMPS